jgi:hypothetical protein
VSSIHVSFSSRCHGALRRGIDSFLFSFCCKQLRKEGENFVGNVMRRKVCVKRVDICMACMRSRCDQHQATRYDAIPRRTLLHFVHRFFHTSCDV